MGLLLVDRADEWKDYAIPFPKELIPSDSVIWLRKDEDDTRTALDNAVKKLHTSGKLLEMAKANRLLNTKYLEEENKKLSAAQ